MAAHEAAEAERQREREAAMAEDGWTVVVRAKGRAKTKQRGGATVMTGGVAPAAAQAAAAAAAASPGAGARPHADFYRFQRRDKRRDELLELQNAFQEDKKRIAELRASRRFKPY